MMGGGDGTLEGDEARLIGLWMRLGRERGAATGLGAPRDGAVESEHRLWGALFGQQ